MAKSLDSEIPELQSAGRQINSHADSLESHVRDVLDVEQSIRGSSRGSTSQALSDALIGLGNQLGTFVKHTRSTAEKLGVTSTRIESADQAGRDAIARIDTHGAGQNGQININGPGQDGQMNINGSGPGIGAPVVSKMNLDF
ncbi:hypothetical protein [Nocardia beijingensis]|uniref:WXG100 family type VII secretion target n=1 Tax=Nocardia beijingensis TaxID=95162 RepID=A0ABW7WR89_9NOCA